MYKSSGDKVKVLAKVILMVGILLTGIVAIVLALVFDNRLYLLIIWVAPILIFPMFYIIHGYGEIIENTAKTSYLLERLLIVLTHKVDGKSISQPNSETPNVDDENIS